MDIRLQLQVRKDPESHKSLYLNEVEKMRGMLRISRMDPSAKNPELCNLLVFIPSISHNYKEEIISGDIFNYALDCYSVLEKGLAHAAVTAIIILKKSKQIDASVFYRQTIPLIETMDKRTKTIFIQFLVSEICRDISNWEIIKDILYTAIKSGVEAHAKRAAYIFIHMISRNIWTDKETTEKVFDLLLGPSSSSVVNFIFMYLLDKLQLTVKEEDIDMPEETKKGTKIKKETLADKKKKEKKKKEIEKKKAKQAEKLAEKEPNIITLLKRIEGRGPYYAARIFKSIKSSEHSHELKLKMAQVVSRIAAYHKVTIKGFLGYMGRFMFPHQDNLPLVFSSIVQSIHLDVPTKEVEAVCEMIIDNFCSDHRDDEVIAYGVNALKEIIKRYPAAAKYDCVQFVLSFKKVKKQKAATASFALRKMIREAEKAVQQTKEEIDIGDSDVDDSDNYNSNTASNEDENELPSEYMEDGFTSTLEECDSISDEDPNGFVPEEKIGKIRKKATKEEMIEKAKAEKYKRKKKDLPSTNKEKQKEKNYTIRKTKRKAIGKKLSKRAKKLMQGKKN